MSYQNIIVETKGRVGIIRLNRPQQFNALNMALKAELGQAIDAYEADEAIGCLLITGNEKAFAAGADIKEMADKTFIEAYLGNFAGTWDRAARARKPIVAAVAGFALGGGCELAMQCDVVIAADNAKFGQPEIKLGVIPGIGGTQRLTRAVGKAKAMDMILTGRMMDAAEAEKSGLVAMPGRAVRGRLGVWLRPRCCGWPGWPARPGSTDWCAPPRRWQPCAKRWGRRRCWWCREFARRERDRPTTKAEWPARLRRLRAGLPSWWWAGPLRRRRTRPGPRRGFWRRSETRISQAEDWRAVLATGRPHTRSCY